MRALLFASVLGSAMSVEQIPDSSITGCSTQNPLPGGLITEDPGNIDTYFVEHPIILKGGEDLSESLFLNPSQAMVVDDNLDDAVNDYRASLDAMKTGFKGFIPYLTLFSSSTGVYSEHAIIVKEYTDYMRQLAAYADSVATGAVKSPLQLASIKRECANDQYYNTTINPDASGITLNQTVFDEWKLGPFDTAPEVGVNAGNCTALETAYRGNCGCDPA